MSFLSSMPGLNMIDSFLNPQRGYEDAADQLAKAWEEAQAYQRPYWQAGQDQLGRLTGAEDSLLNPSKLLNEWLQGYETSPYAKDELARSQSQGLDAASSMGLMGSSSALENLQRTGSNIVNADRSNYLNDLMQKYMTGIGIGQNIYGTGAGMGANLGQGALNTGQMMGQAAFGSRNAPGEMLSKILGAAIGAAGRGGY